MWCDHTSLLLWLAPDHAQVSDSPVSASCAPYRVGRVKCLRLRWLELHSLPPQRMSKAMTVSLRRLQLSQSARANRRVQRVQNHALSTLDAGESRSHSLPLTIRHGASQGSDAVNTLRSVTAMSETFLRPGQSQSPGHPWRFRRLDMRERRNFGSCVARTRGFSGGLGAARGAFARR